MIRLAALLLSSFALAAASASPKIDVLGSEAPKGLSKNDWSSIQAAYQASRHEVKEAADQSGTWQAHNPGQQWTTRFDGRGFDTQPQDASWSWGLQLQRWGMAGAEQAVSGIAQVTRNGQRAHYRWGSDLEEWYVNDQRGLEHGYTVHRRPPGESDQLRFELAVRGGLIPQIDSDGRDVQFFDGSGVATLTYSGLKVWDADGVILPATFAALDQGLALAINTAGARYPITVDPLAQQAYLKASNTDAGDQFGGAVAISGDTVVVGAVGEDSSATGVNSNQFDNSGLNAGAAYVFVRTGSTWAQQAYLKASNAQGDSFVLQGSDGFGVSVAISGDTLVVGALGEDSNATGVNGDQANNSGLNSGAAYVFVRSGSTWTQQAYLKASNTSAVDRFGSSVAISGNTVVVSAPEEDSNSTGVDGEQSNNNATDAGAAYVFERSGTMWTQQAYLKASNADASDSFGISVAIAGNTVVVGARFEDSNAGGVNNDQANNSFSAAGAAYVFARSGSTWSQQAYLKASNTDALDNFGLSVAIAGDTVVVGAAFEDSNASGVNGNQTSNSASDAGAAYVYVRSGSTWSQQAYLKASNPDAGDLFGESVAIADNTVMVGAAMEGSNATGVNGNQLDNSASNSGAAHVFEVPSFTIGGTVTGLSGSGLVLRNNGGNNLSVAANGAFTFTTPIASGSPYAVTVFTQPGSPSQSCTVTNGTGTVGTANVTNVSVNCVTAGSFTIGGVVTGLAGTGLILRNNGAELLGIPANGMFTFVAPIASGAPYAVTAVSQPGNPSQTCTVTNGSGTVGVTNVTNVQVACTTTTFTVGGTVTGLTGTGLVLRNNGGNNLAIVTNGGFNFTTPIASGSPYAVTVFTQPGNPSQSCTVTNGAGTVGTANVTNVSVNCVTASTFTIGGAVTGLAGNGLVLRNNGGNNLSVAANGAFTFTSPVASGGVYAVTVFVRPSNPTQTCAVVNGSGTVGGANVVNVQITCITSSFTIGGSVSGLLGTGLVLRNNGGNNLAITGNGIFTFGAPAASGGMYAVTVAMQPSNPAQSCALTNASGTVSSASVTNVAVACAGLSEEIFRDGFEASPL